MDTIVLQSDDITLVSEGGQGPAGPPGTGIDLLVSKVASETMSAYRAVVADGAANILLANNTDSTHRARVLGIIEQAVTAGFAVNVKREGEMSFIGWSWVPNLPIFVGVGGLLTQTAPVSPAVFSQIIAVAASATVIELGIRTYTNII